MFGGTEPKGEGPFGEPYTRCCMAVVSSCREVLG